MTQKASEQLQDMAQAWEFIGEYRPYLIRDDKDAWVSSCCAGANFAGWARQASQETSTHQEDWRILLEDNQWPLLLEGQDRDFLGLCATAQLECWTTGQLLCSGGEAHVVPLIFSVYSTRGAAILVPRRVASRICDSTMLYAMQDLWNARFAGELPTLGICTSMPSSLHPLAHGHLSACLRSIQEPRLVAALLFLLHAEATSLSRLCIFYGQDAARLGSSSFYYNPLDDSVASYDARPSAPVGEVARGCLLLGRSARILLRVLREFLSRPPRAAAETPSPPARTLIVASREDLPFAHAALRDLDLALATKSADLASSDTNFVLTSGDALVDRLSEDPLFAARTWDRLVTIGWPRAVQPMLIAELPVKFSFHLGLSVYEDTAAEVDRESLGFLLGVSPGRLSDASSLRALMEQRVMHVEDMGSILAEEKPKLTFRDVQVAAGSAAETAVLQQYHGIRRRKRALFGALCGPTKPSFRPLAPGASVLEHFTRRQATAALDLDAFAVEQLSRGVAPREGCPVCYEPEAFVATRCGHWFCEACLDSSLTARARCPTCRRELHRARDIVHTRPSERALEAGFMRQLLEALVSAGSGRTLVVASFGDLHERLASYLCAEGGLRVRAWRGNTTQLLQNLRRFEEAPRTGCGAALLVDPESLPLAWACWPELDRIFLLWPLEADEAHGCCQLNSVLKALPPQPRPPEITVFSHGRPLCLPSRCSHDRYFSCDLHPH